MQSTSIVFITSVICLVLCSVALTAIAEERFKLGVYMESLCPDTRRFFLRQLVPTYREIGSIMDLKLVPFGHARTLGNNRMICQHGARECEGNRRMACLLARSTNQSEIVETFGCLFAQEETTKDCVSKNMPNVNFDQVEKCTSGDESYQLMVQAEKDTGRISYVPKLTANDQYSEDIQEQLEGQLKETVCKQYKGSVSLDACKNVASAQ